MVGAGNPQPCGHVFVEFKWPFNELHTVIGIVKRDKPHFMPRQQCRYLRSTNGSVKVQIGCYGLQVLYPGSINMDRPLR